MKPVEYLKGVRHELMNDGSQPQIDRAEGAVLALVGVGLLNDVEADGWRTRFQRCPGHEICRTWCAYCGDIPMAEDDPRRDP